MPNALARLVTKWFGPKTSFAERQLLQACRGDAEMCGRLIAHELGRQPYLSRADAASAAVERWNRDR